MPSEEIERLYGAAGVHYETPAEFTFARTTVAGGELVDMFLLGIVV